MILSVITLMEMRIQTEILIRICVWLSRCVVSVVSTVAVKLVPELINNKCNVTTANDALLLPNTY